MKFDKFVLGQKVVTDKYCNWFIITVIVVEITALILCGVNTYILKEV